MSKAMYNHLVSNIANTKDNREFIKKVNKMSKDSNSIWKLFIKYRKPKEGFKYNSGGSLKCENANAFSVYIQDRRPYNETPISNAWARQHELIIENQKLKKKIAILENPYIDCSISDLNTEIFEIKETIIEKSLENEIAANVPIDNHYGSISLKTKYNLLMEALTYAEQSE